MLTRIELLNFKGFRAASAPLGPLTLVVGTNASGKSNLRDAFRLLHGIGRGYSLADAIGEKWGEGGVLQWRGIRGGRREAATIGEDSFALAIDTSTEADLFPAQFGYRIEVGLGTGPEGPRVVEEGLYRDGELLYDSHPSAGAPEQREPGLLAVRLQKTGTQKRLGAQKKFADHSPVLSRISGEDHVPAEVSEAARLCLRELAGMRFLDLSPDAMRVPSNPGQVILGDRGENLSSVLMAICSQPATRAALLEWVRELTPLDVMDFEFPEDYAGRVLLHLVEKSGIRISAHSASDGTLRFLAMVGALLGPKSGHFYFFEEFDNGIHPTRLHLLLQLVDQATRTSGVQVVATSHSPQILSFLGEAAREAALLVYRREGESAAHIRRIWDIPDVRRVIETQDLARLHAAGWFEDVVTFLSDEELEEGGR